MIFPHFDAAEHVCNLETGLSILARRFVPHFVTDAGAIGGPLGQPFDDLADDAEWGKGVATFVASHVAQSSQCA